MKGCPQWPAYGRCNTVYRGPTCEVIRYSFGLEGDPEILSYADKIRAMSDEELADGLMKIFYSDVLDHDPAAWYCTGTKTCGEMIDNGEKIPDEWCRECLLKKLRQPAGT